MFYAIPIYDLRNIYSAEEMKKEDRTLRGKIWNLDNIEDRRRIEAFAEI